MLVVWLQRENGTKFEKKVLHIWKMTKKLQSLNTNQLRSLFLTQSKLFLKALDYSEATDQETRSLLLHELRDSLKTILELIKEREKKECWKLSNSLRWFCTI